MTPQLLDIHHGFNFRDLGGYPTMAGKTVRSHRVLRSGRMNDLSERDQDYLARYGLRLDLDFRSRAETVTAPDRLPDGVTYDHTPVFVDDETKVSANIVELRKQYSTDPLAGFKNMINTYHNLVQEPTAQQAYRHFFDQLLANETGALLFHCAAGKDRTGMGAVYLLTVLGVDPVTIRQDYLASNNYLTGEILRMTNEAKAAGGTPELVATTRSLCSVTNEYLDAAMLLINHDYGSLPHYLATVIGVTPAQQRDLQALYLE